MSRRRAHRVAPRAIAVLTAAVLLLAAAGLWALNRADGQAPRKTPKPAQQAAPSIRWTTSNVDMTWQGAQRYYLLIRPSGRSGPLPVILVLHGHASWPSFEATRMNFVQLGVPAILVYPAGSDESWNAGLCCPPASDKHVDDVGFLSAVLGQVLATQPDADRSRVFLAGYSNGGKMAFAMACAAPGLFRGIAAYGAVAAAPCTGPPPVSVLEVASTGDNELKIGPGGTPQTGGQFVAPTVYGEVSEYRYADGCTAATTTSQAGSLTETVWTSCRNGRQVGLALYQGGSHTWPTGADGSPSGQEVMWSFFARLGA